MLPFCPKACIRNFFEIGRLYHELLKFEFSANFHYQLCNSKFKIFSKKIFADSNSASSTYFMWICFGTHLYNFGRTDGRTDGQTDGRTDGRTFDNFSHISQILVSRTEMAERSYFSNAKLANIVARPRFSMYVTFQASKPILKF